MASRKIEDLIPDLQTKAKYLKEYFKSRFDILITCTYRSPEEQNVLYSQGREDLLVVNKKRKLIGLTPITFIENKIVTNCRGGESLHNSYPSHAFDFVIVENGKCIWNTSDTRWNIVGKKGIDIGLDWAGNWKRMKEMAHFQMPVSKTKEDKNEG